MNSKSATVSIIAAIGKNRELGKDNQLLFEIPEDMKFFREKTRGHPVIMGRKTAQHLVDFYTKGPLPGRTNIVVSRNKNIQLEGFEIVDSIEKAIEIAKKTDNDEVFIIGGAQVYKLALPHANKLYLTLVNAEVPDADAFFPDYSEFKMIVSERKSVDENYVYNFLELTR